MLRNYLITAFRFLQKNRLFTCINIAGLAVSISCALLIYLYVRYEFNYDEFHDDIDRLYMLGEGSNEENPEEAAYYQTVYPALPLMLEQFPEIETGSRYFDWDAHILLVGEKRFMYQALYVDSTLRESEAGNETYIYGLATVGIFILVIAIINFMNLSVATSLKRLRETGMRKLMGSTKKSIVLQFFLEACLLSCAAVVLSFGFVGGLLPSMNDILGLSLALSADNIIEAALLSAGLAIIMGLVAGGYPALYLSAYKTVNAVKGIIPNYQNKITLRNALVVVQFIVSVTMIIGVIVASHQIHFMKTADLKFNRENVLVINLDAGFKEEKVARPRLQGIINQLESKADVLSLSLSQNVPGRYRENYNRFLPEGDEKRISLRKAYVDDEYLKTYGIKLLEGRNFSREIASDTLNKVMLNAAALTALGWKSSVGKALKENGSDQIYTVVGVFDDFHYRSLEGDVEPLIHFFFNKIEYTRFLSIRIMPDKVAGILTLLQNEWKSLDAWLGFNYFFVDEEFDAQYKGIERTLVLISFFASVAIVISCAGIFALSAITAQHRTKEIGIRKVLGASVQSIVGLLSKDFIKLVVIAMILAAPLAWYGMSLWLEDFAYKIPLDWWIFALAGAIALLVALVTTGLQSVRAALNNPVDSLRNE